jgi:hypothetical protein
LSSFTKEDKLKSGDPRKSTPTANDLNKMLEKGKPHDAWVGQFPKQLSGMINQKIIEESHYLTDMTPTNTNMSHYSDMNL